MVNKYSCIHATGQPLYAHFFVLCLFLFNLFLPVCLWLLVVVLTLSALSAASRLVASVCSLCWAMFFSAARLRRVIACFRFTAEWLRASTVAGASSSQAFRISTAVIPITQRSNAPGTKPVNKSASASEDTSYTQTNSLIFFHPLVHLQVYTCAQ